MKRVLILGVLSLIGIVGVHAQVEHKCGYMDAIEKLDKEFPGIKLEMDKDYLESVKMAKYSRARRSKYDTIYTLQVVFHVLYNNSFENLDDSVILSQLQILNEDYRRQNSDTTETRDVFKPVAGDTKIEFMLATEDPNGNPTNGINRVSTSNSTFYTRNRSDLMKFTSSGGVDAWDTKRYLNIWVCDYSIPNVGPSILGYAYPPKGAKNWTSQTNNVADERQGVVLHYQIVGKYNRTANTTAVQYALGRTGTHEVGHYLGLRHTWGDGTNTNGCSVDDFVDDTPNERTRNGFGAVCATNRNTCTDANNDLPDQTENYMDYSRNICQNMFTNQQISIMRYNLVNLRPGMATNPTLVKNPNFQDIDLEFAILNNSTESNFQVHIANEDDDSKSIIIRNSIGQIVLEYKDQGKLEGKSFDASYLASGIYYVTVYSSAGSEINTGKLFKK